MLKYIKEKRPNMRLVKIDGDIGYTLDKVRNGEKFFKISTDHKNWPNKISKVVEELGNILIKEKMNGTKKMQEGWTLPTLINPKYPQLSSEIKNKMRKNIKLSNNSVKDYVEAIIIRENNLLNHVDDIEKYYIDSAKDINSYRLSLKKYLKDVSCAKNKTEVPLLTEKRYQNIIDTNRNMTKNYDRGEVRIGDYLSDNKNKETTSIGGYSSPGSSVIIGVY